MEEEDWVATGKGEAEDVVVVVEKAEEAAEVVEVGTEKMEV